MKPHTHLFASRFLSMADDEETPTVSFAIQVLEKEHRRLDMLWTIFVVLLILWLLGFSLHVGGGLIHLLLVVGLAVLVINLLSGRRGAV
jgi:4-hydroxybenzoate polyprenyltransferase